MSRLQSVFRRGSKLTSSEPRPLSAFDQQRALASGQSRSLQLLNKVHDVFLHRPARRVPMAIDTYVVFCVTVSLNIFRKDGLARVAIDKFIPRYGIEAVAEHS